MHASIVAGLFAFVATAVTAQYNIASKPFYLTLTSKDATVNGHVLFACHEGAAIEGLCLGGLFHENPDASTFGFNTSAYGSSGVLTYTLVGGNFVESEPMSLEYNPASNVAVPLFAPGYDTTYVGFDKDNKLYIPSYIDDTHAPPVAEGSEKDYYRWYICDTYAGYSYTTLAWTAGLHSPQNPSCKKVDVVRVFAT